MFPARSRNTLLGMPSTPKAAATRFPRSKTIGKLTGTFASHCSAAALSHLLAAGAAPGRPEIEHDDLSAQFAQAQVAAVATWQIEVGRGAVGARRDHGGEHECRDSTVQWHAVLRLRKTP